MVDYTFDGWTVLDFRCYLADWGTTGKYRGGTPMYAGPRTYESDCKDFFTFGRLTLEMFLEPEGK